MKCHSQGQADRIALRGGSKLIAEGYKLIRSQMNRNFFRVQNPEGVWYQVRIGGPEGVHCTCPFYKENPEFGTCKHIVGCQFEAEAQDYCAAHGLVPGEIPLIAPSVAAPTTPARSIPQGMGYYPPQLPTSHRYSAVA